MFTLTRERIRILPATQDHFIFVVLRPDCFVKLHMIIEITSVDKTLLIRPGDVIFDNDAEKFLVTNVLDNYIVLIQQGTSTNLKILPLADLAAGNWRMESRTIE